MEQHQDVLEETKHEDNEEKLQENKAKEQDEISQQKLGDDHLDEVDATVEKTGKEEDTVDIEKQEETEDTGLQPVCVDNVDNKTSEILSGSAATPAASPQGENLDHESAEEEQETKSINEHETSESCPNKEDDERIVPCDAKAVETAVGETLKMRAERSKEQEALDIEEAPVDEEEGRQKRESEEGATAENTAEITAAATDIINEQKMELGENDDGDLIKEEVAEENTQEKKGEEEENNRKSVEIDEEKENKTEDLIQEPEKPIESQEITDMKVEDEEEMVENEKDVSELNVGESAMEDRASESNKDTGEEKTQESGDNEVEDGEFTTADNKMNEGQRGDEEQIDKVEAEKEETQTEAESENVDIKEMAEAEAEKSVETLNHGVENIEEESGAVNKTSEATAETISDAAVAPAKNDIEVDVENGEISVKAQNETLDNQVEPQAGGEVEVNRAGNVEDEVHAREPAPVEPTDRQGTTRDGTDKRGEDEAELPSFADVLETMATAENKSEGKQEGSVVNKSEVEKSGDEMKEEGSSYRKEAKQDENGNVSELGGGKQNSDSINQDNDAESNVTGLRDAVPETPAGAGSEEDQGKFKEPSEMREADKCLDADTITTDQPTSKGETEEAEEASKTSEEGASVLVKPQGQTSPSKDECVATVIVANEDNVDLVSNWVNTHQASRFFETFVDPLDDLKEPDAQEFHIRSAGPVKEATTSVQGGLKKTTTEESAGSGLESSHSKDGQQGKSAAVEDLLQVQDEQQEADIMPEGDKDGQPNGQELVEDQLQAQEESLKADEMAKAYNDKVSSDKDVFEDLLQMQPELEEKDLIPGTHKEGQTNVRDIVEELLEEQEESQRADLLPQADNDGAATEEDPAGDPLQAQEEPEKTDGVQEGDKDDMIPEEPRRSRMSQQEHIDTSQTEVESIAGTQRSITSSTSESVSQLKTDNKITETTSDLSAKQRPVELPDSGLVPETKEHQGWSSSSENLLEEKKSALKDIQDSLQPSEEVTEISVLTAGRNHEETYRDHQDQTQTRMPGEGIVRDVRLIEDIQRTLSKDRLSPFTVDGTLLAQNSYPMLSVVRTESKH